MLAVPTCVLASATVLAAQPGARPARSAQQRAADRALTFLELPARRSEGVADLLRLGEAAGDALLRGIDDPRPEIAMTCMHVVRELGPAAEKTLPRLQVLATSKDTRIAHAAAWAMARLRPQGLTLIAEYGSNQIREFDAAGKCRFVLPKLIGCWDVERLANGNLLVTLYTAKKVVELTSAGKEVWSYTTTNLPLDADRLPDGNTLICDTYANSVVEVDPKGGVVWRYDGKTNPYDADRLPDGNTLICDYNGNRVIEVDRAGKIVWSVTAANPFGADRLQNGNTLITMFGKGTVREVDRKGGVVHDLTGLSSPNEARRLPNGHTLVAEAAGVREFDANDKEVRRIQTGRVGTVHRY